MAVPTSKTDRPAISRGSSGTNSRSPARRRISRAVANQIGIIVRNPRWVARWLNIGCGDRGVIGDFLLKIADRDVERAAGQEICGCVVKARLGKLPVGGGAGEIRKAQSSGNHHKGENNDQRSASGCAITRTKELFHGVKTFMEVR